MNIAERTQYIKRLSQKYGFAHIGIGKAEHMDEEARHLESWLNTNHHGQMSYMANHFDKRVDPSKLVPGAKSVVSLMYNYFPKEEQTSDTYKVARYAYGQDYHQVVKNKLRDMLAELQSTIGEINGRCFVDSAPVLERDWAKRNGLGWIGKNTLLLNKDRGSYFFLSELIIDVAFDYDHPVKDHCGTCTRCIDACPTDAISPDGYVMDGSKCISYATIELKEAIPDDFKDKMEDWVFGCDICQEVCPWNRFSTPHEEPLFDPQPGLLDISKSEWHDLTEEVFRSVFKKSAVKRTKYSGLTRNIQFAKAD
jgi:epoxyqueuosine reductase